MEIDYKQLFERLTKRYGGATPGALESILCPVLIGIRTLDKTIIRLPKQTHYRASFTITVDELCEDLIVPGPTGKFVPETYRERDLWREIAKGRILRVDRQAAIAEGEVYCGGRKPDLTSKEGGAFVVLVVMYAVT